MKEQITKYHDMISIYADKKFSILFDPKNHHMVTSPMPNNQDLENIYANDYSFDAHKEISLEKRFRARVLYKKVKKYVRSNSSVLEIGPMFGDFLKILQKDGHTVKGIELSKFAVSICHKNGLNVLNQNANNYLESTTDTFDYVHVSHSLEHFLSPESVLKSIHAKLNKNGTITIVVPNNRSTLIRLFGKRWGYWAVPVHINHFSSNSLACLVESCGFHIKSTMYVGGDSLMWISTVMNIFKMSGKAKRGTSGIRTIEKIILKIASFMLMFWIKVGNDDLIVVAEKKSVKP